MLVTKYLVDIVWPPKKVILRISAEKSGIVALIDVDKGNMMDVVNKKHVKSLQGWGGSCTKDGRYGLCAPPTGGMDILDLRFLVILLILLKVN